MQNQWNLSDFITSKIEYKNSTSSFKHVVHEIIWIILCHRWPWSVSSFKQRSRSLQNLKIHHYLVHIVQNFALYYYKWLLNIFQHLNTYRSHLFNAIKKVENTFIILHHLTLNETRNNFFLVEISNPHQKWNLLSCKLMYLVWGVFKKSLLKGNAYNIYFFMNIKLLWKRCPLINPWTNLKSAMICKKIT